MPPGLTRVSIVKNSKPVTAALLRQGHHCQYPGDAGNASFLYFLRLTNDDYRIRRQWLESPVLDRNNCNDGYPLPVNLWWTIDVHGFEVVQSSEVGLTAQQYFGPEEAWQPEGLPLPTFLDATRHTHLKARVRWINNSGVREYVDIDIGHGQRLAVQSDQVFVDLLIPPDALPVLDGGNETVLPPPLVETPVAQALIAGSVNASPYSPAGQQIVTNTIIVNVPQGQPLNVQIPPRAKRVQVYQEFVGLAVSPFWNTALVRSPGPVYAPFARDSGILGIDPLTFRTPVLDIPQHCSLIRIPLNANNPRLYAFVFELDLK